MKGAIWFALAADFRRTVWIRSEREAVKSAWVSLLALVKEAAPRKGMIEYKGWDDLAYRMHFHADDYDAVRRLIEVATADGAVQIDRNRLSITNWKVYQFGGGSAASEQNDDQNTKKQPQQNGVKPNRTWLNDVEPHSTQLKAPEPDRTGLNDVECQKHYVYETERQSINKREEDISSSLVDSNKKAPSKMGVRALPARGGFSPDAWENLISAYPPRNGDLGRSKAKLIFERLTRQGVDPLTIINGASRYCAWATANDKAGTAYVKQIPTWLNQRGWEEPWGLSDGIVTNPDPVLGVDFAMRDTNPRDRNGFVIKIDLETNEPWDESAWRKRKGLPPK